MNYGNITTIVSLSLACLIMLYYCDTTMEYKNSRLKSYCITILGYFFYCIICMQGIPPLNIASCFIINFFVIYLGYRSSIGRAIIQVIILTAFVMFGELLVSLFINIKIDNNTAFNSTLIGDVLFTFPSKIIYFILVVIFKKVTIDRHNEYRAPEMLWIIILPISTCGFLALFNQLHGLLNQETEIFYIVISIMLIISNLIVYVVCEHIIEKNQKIQYLQKNKQKQEIDFKNYQLIKEKYNDLRIMVHDFNKYCNGIEALLSENQVEALSLIQNIRNENKEFLLVEYTNNTALNILLSQKMKECNKQKIDFQLYVKDIDISFINEMDVISIFSNLIDNAMESCMMSKSKKIFFNINSMNNSYIVIRVINSADKEPMVINNHLFSRKRDQERHGIGLMSIKKNLSKYGGDMQWQYDSDTCTFTATVLIQPLNSTEVAL